MQFITEQEFLLTIARFRAHYPRVQHWSENRWDYHAAAIEILREQLPAGVEKVLEIGPMGVQLVPGSDVLDYKVRLANWPVKDPKYLHDATKFPWPIGDKAYDLLIALRVFQHLVPVQRQAFDEARRVARNLLIVVPEEYGDNSIGSQGISRQAFVEWNDGVEPTASVKTDHGDVYFWNELALEKNSTERQT